MKRVLLSRSRCFSSSSSSLSPLFHGSARFDSANTGVTARVSSVVTHAQVRGRCVLAVTFTSADPRVHKYVRALVKHELCLRSSLSPERQTDVSNDEFFFSWKGEPETFVCVVLER